MWQACPAMGERQESSGTAEDVSSLVPSPLVFRPVFVSDLQVGYTWAASPKEASKRREGLVRQITGRHGLIVAVLLSAGLITGCGGTGRTFYMELPQKGLAAQYVEPEPVKIVVEPFDDRRLEKTRLGMRTHLWGGVTYFQVAGERPGHVVAQALVERLKNRGWRDRAWDVRMAAPGSTTDSDIVISGQILDLSANAKSRVFSTVLSTSLKLVFTARNAGDQTTTTRSVEGAQHDTVVWFTDKDLQELTATTLQDGIERYIGDTTIEQGVLRPGR